MISSVNPANNSRHNRSHQEKTEKGDKDICEGSSNAPKTRDDMGKSEDRAKKHDSVSGERSEEDPEGDASKLAIEPVEGCIHNLLLCLCPLCGESQWKIETPNDPSSAPRPAKACDCNRSAMAGEQLARLRPQARFGYSPNLHLR